MNLLIINGPNLNLLGKRETSIYGNTSFESYFDQLTAEFSDDNLSYFQSNHEGEIIDKLHTEGYKVDGIVLNAGAYTHTSLAIADAIAGIESPVIEVHISNVHKREKVRHKSFITAVCKGVIAGFGLNSYRLAVEALKRSL
ncbi:type II 3-dehydroquinate dehydratase [Carboxylicivirga sp. M1479]|uniref:type II 3-dehydroquinate dehydratase n=1 Tax=Carboxylicivirga sp. M1479 TaxID=2594476 RepID=UPI0011777754|nr:type II 3-dehydroquinate dehydratase [Carboxylicivirga sp. M1479]TRX66367.1 type II 3-dehydroquinate dehydratase [Carboxylicivirga sp. M1479]